MKWHPGWLKPRKRFSLTDTNGNENQLFEANEFTPRRGNVGKTIACLSAKQSASKKSNHFGETLRLQLNPAVRSLRGTEERGLVEGAHTHSPRRNHQHFCDNPYFILR